MFARGCVLGQVAAVANEVQTLTVTGTPTAGNVTVSVVDPITAQTLTFSLPYYATPLDRRDDRGQVQRRAGARREVQS